MAFTSHADGIIDIRRQHAQRVAGGQDTLRDHIVAGLLRPVGQKELPTMLLYDERGLRLYDDITTMAPEYYLFPAEEQILKDHADQIVRSMHAYTGGAPALEEVVVELGAGLLVSSSLRKTSHILLALSRMVTPTMDHTPIHYYALDLEERELSRTLGSLGDSDVGEAIQGKVSTKGICGTYDDGLQFIEEGGLEGRGNLGRLPTAFSEQYKVEKTNRDTSPSSGSSRSTEATEDTPPSTPGVHQPLHVLFLGSSLGNFSRGEDVAFLRSLPLRAGSGDTLLLGLDQDNAPEEIEAAYNDPKGITKTFILNGLRCAGKALGDENLFGEDKWEYVGKYNEQERRHEAFYKAKAAHAVVDPVTKAEYSFDANELVRIEVSHKYTDQDAYSLFTNANLRPIHRWTDSASKYSLWLLERPQFLFPLLASPATASALPESSALSVRVSASTPFGLPCIEEWQTMWSAWDFITQRMIPPSMLFQKPIDLRHICLFYCGHIPTFLSIHLARLLNEPDTEPVQYKYIFERGIDPIVDDPTQCHSHSEVPTCDEDWPSLPSILAFQARVRARLLKLYGDIDTGKVELTRKVARVLFMTLEHEAFHAEPPAWTTLAEAWNSAPPPTTPTVTLGPTTVILGHDDDEADDASTDVAGHDFGWDNEHPRRAVQVRKFAIDVRPVTNGEFFEYYNGKGKGIAQFPASWIEEDGETRVRTLYGPVPMDVAQHWPVVTSYDNLSAYATVKGGRIPTEPELRLFMDMFACGYEGGANIGFRHWHAVPATTGGEKDAKGHNGGVWEWTSTALDKYDGFVTSKLYPGYSTDFFDTHHQVVVGGSYATIPRLAERRTLRNFYQHNYPYAWVGGRVAYDLAE
ncbi:hypothetical protein B0H21DRAFT_825820 [Amylocystis lapponica]|nr:hypothetical protein B0H21DRAFT_825820 [Amylocystis lapponica]